MRGVRAMDVPKPLSSSTSFAAPGAVMVRPLLLKPQWMNGLSERLLVSHYVNNYGGGGRRGEGLLGRGFRPAWGQRPPIHIKRPQRGGKICAGFLIPPQKYF